MLGARLQRGDAAKRLSAQAAPPWSGCRKEAPLFPKIAVGASAILSGARVWARRQPVAAAALFLLFLLFLQFPGVLLLRQVPFVSEMVAGSDLLDFNYPVRRILGDALRRGTLPHWTDAMNTGFPIHGEGQGGFLYPPNLLLGWLPLVASINLSLVLTYLGAGLLMFLYARELEQSRVAALFAGMVFAFSGFFFGHIRHLNLIAAAQWLPLLLLLCERYARTRRPAYLLALAPVQALQHLAGHPQTAYYSILFTGVYLILRVLQREVSVDATPSSPGRLALRSLRAAALAAAGFVLAAGLGAGLAGVQLLPTWELAQLAHRSAKDSLEKATYYTLPWQHLVTFVSPFFFGDPGRNTYSFFAGGQAVLFWENCGYVGLLPLVLALYATGALWRRDRRVALLAGAAVVSLLLAMGKQTPLFPFLWRHLPGMGEFRIPARFLLVTDLALAALAGYGFDLARSRLATWRLRLAPALVGLCFALTAAELLSHASRQYALVDARKWLGPAPVMAAIGADRDQCRVYTWHEVVPWQDALEHSRGWQRDPEAFYPLRNTLLPNFGVLQGMPHYSAYTGFFFTDKGRLDAQINRLLAGQSPDAIRLGLRLLGLYNAGYITAPDDLSPGGARLIQGFPAAGRREASVRLWRNPYLLPRAYLACWMVAYAIFMVARGLLRKPLVLVNADAALLLSISAGYGFIANVGDMVSRQRAGKAFITCNAGETVCPPSPLLGVPNDNGESKPATHVACASAGGRLLTFALGELKSMPNGGRGLMLISLDDKDALNLSYRVSCSIEQARYLTQ